MNGSLSPGSTSVIIQARMGSSRLPGKTLEPLGEWTVLDWVVRRAQMAERVSEVIVATSTNPEDDAIEAHLSGSSATVVRGSADDVLARFGLALASTDADRIVRVTADCPLLQPELIDRAIGIADELGVVYVATDLDGRMPRGFDLEVVGREALEVALEEAIRPDEREHVTPFIVRRPGRFPAAPLEAPEWAQRTDVRLTLDEPDDLRMLRALVSGMEASPESLSGPALFAYLDAHPEVAAINRHVAHRTIT